MCLSDGLQGLVVHNKASQIGGIHSGRDLYSVVEKYGELGAIDMVATCDAQSGVRPINESQTAAQIRESYARSGLVGLCARNKRVRRGAGNHFVVGFDRYFHRNIVGSRNAVFKCVFDKRNKQQRRNLAVGIISQIDIKLDFPIGDTQLHKVDIISDEIGLAPECNVFHIFIKHIPQQGRQAVHGLFGIVRTYIHQCIDCIEGVEEKMRVELTFEIGKLIWYAVPL